MTKLLLVVLLKTLQILISVLKKSVSVFFRITAVRNCVFFAHFSDIVRIFCLMSEIFGVILDKVSEKLLLIARQLHGHVAAPCSLNLLKFCEFLFATKPLPL